MATRPASRPPLAPLPEAPSPPAPGTRELTLVTTLRGSAPEPQRPPSGADPRAPGQLPMAQPPGRVSSRSLRTGSTQGSPAPTPLPRGAPSTRRAAAASGAAPQSPGGRMAGLGRGRDRPPGAGSAGRSRPAGAAAGPSPPLGSVSSPASCEGGTKARAAVTLPPSLRARPRRPPTGDAHPARAHTSPPPHPARYCPAPPPPAPRWLLPLEPPWPQQAAGLCSRGGLAVPWARPQPGPNQYPGPQKP